MRSIQEKSRKSINSDLQEELIKSIQGEVRFDDISRQMYSTDGSIYSIIPVGVTIPTTSDDVSAIIEICNKNNVAILPRGGGTSLSGQTVNSAVVIDFSKYMNKIIEINSDEKWVITEPGITIDNLNESVKKHNLHS